MTPTPSDEHLGAWIDGELTPADAAVLLEQSRIDAALRERVSQLRLGKELVRHAFADLAPPMLVAPHLSRRRPWRAAAVGVVVFACGATLGWLLREQAALATDPLTRLAERATLAEHERTRHVILHLSSAEAPLALEVLERAEGILHTARADGRSVAVEIVANAGGLDLLREGVSAHAQRIAAMRLAYPDLVLVACGQTAQRLREGGTDVRLLPGVVTATSALDEIVMRMQLGWSYVRI